MGIEIPLLFFGLFAISVILVFVCVGTMRVSLARNPLTKWTGNYTWGYVIAYLATIILVLTANVGWWGGWITLVIWGVQTLA